MRKEPMAERGQNAEIGRKGDHAWKKIIKEILLAVLAIIICMPVLLVVLGSLKSHNELLDSLSAIFTEDGGKIRWSFLPLYPTLMHYVNLLWKTPQFFTVFWNSVRIAACILGGQIFIAIPAGWAFARYEYPCKKLIFTIYVLLMLMPFQVTMLPSYLVLNQLGLVNTQAAVILPAVFSTFPVFLIYRGFATIPKGLMEAARIDGANEWIIFMKIGIPLGKSGILSALVLGFLDCWNLIEQPLTFLNDKSLWPLSLYLPEIGGEQVGIAFAASVITLIPAAFVFIIGQDYMEQGIVATGLKE